MHQYQSTPLLELTAEPLFQMSATSSRLHRKQQSESLECAVTGYCDTSYVKGFTAEQLQGAERQLAEACRDNKIYAVLGMPHRDGAKLYNSAVVIDPNGKVVERYHKIQLHGQSRVIAPDGNIVREATIFGAEVVTATLDLSKATGGMAQRSIDRGPLGDWWWEAVKKVRLID
jgi:predicted amidohydrolase